MAKKVLTTIKLQAVGGAGQPGAAGRPRAGPARHQHHGVLQGVQRPDAGATRARSSRSSSRSTRTARSPSSRRRRRPPCSSSRRSGSTRARASRTATRSARSPQAQLREIAERKLPDLNAHDVDQAAKIIAGTARSMGVEVDRLMAKPRQAATSRPRPTVDREHEYAPAEAVALVKELGRAKFDESVEIHVRTGPQRPPRRRAAARHDRAAATGWARTSRSPSSPRATRRARPRRPAPTSSAPRTSPSASRRASPTSTSRSRRRT